MVRWAALVRLSELRLTSGTVGLAGDHLVHRGEVHECGRVLRQVGPEGEEVGVLGFGDGAEVFQAGEEDAPEGIGPVPHGGAGAGGIGFEAGEVVDGEAGVEGDLREFAHDVGVAAVVAPACVYGRDDALEEVRARGDAHRVVAEVVLDEETAAGLEEAGDAGDDGLWIGDEAEEPAEVGDVEGGWFEGVEGVERGGVGDEETRVGEVAALGLGVGVGDIGGGLVDADDAAGVADELGEIKRGESRAGADVEDGLAGGDMGAVPEVVGGPGPEPVLKAEAFELGGVGAQDIFAS